MLKVNILVNDVEDQLEASMDVGLATLSDLTNCERMLRRYLAQVIDAANRLLDKDTRNKGETKKVESKKEAPKVEKGDAPRIVSNKVVEIEPIEIEPDTTDNPDDL